jgi:hypothetical protein
VENGNKGQRARILTDLNRRSFTTVSSKKAVDAEHQKPREKQFTTVYLNVKTRMYSVHPYVRGPVSWTEFGEPTVLSSEQFDAEIATAVLGNLEKFNKYVFDQELTRRRTPTEQRVFVKHHLSVHVARLETNEIKVSPQHRERGGYVGDEENPIVIRPDEVPEKFAQAMREAFGRAT